MNQIAESATLVLNHSHFNVVVGGIAFALVHLLVARALFAKPKNPSQID